jgi:hypothetical protein
MRQKNDNDVYHCPTKKNEERKLRLLRDASMKHGLKFHVRVERGSFLVMDSCDGR